MEENWDIELNEPQPGPSGISQAKTEAKLSSDQQATSFDPFKKEHEIRGFPRPVLVHRTDISVNKPERPYDYLNHVPFTSQLKQEPEDDCVKEQGFHSLPIVLLRDDFISRKIIDACIIELYWLCMKHAKSEFKWNSIIGYFWIACITYEKILETIEKIRHDISTHKQELEQKLTNLLIDCMGPFYYHKRFHYKIRFNRTLQNGFIGEKAIKYSELQHLISHATKIYDRVLQHKADIEKKYKNIVKDRDFIHDKMTEQVPSTSIYNLLKDEKLRHEKHRDKKQSLLGLSTKDQYDILKNNMRYDIILNPYKRQAPRPNTVEEAKRMKKEIIEFEEEENLHVQLNKTLDTVIYPQKNKK